MSIDPRHPHASYLDFWRERHVCTLTTLRPDGTPHTVPVGVTYDPGAGLARIITSKSSTKARNVLAAAATGTGEAPDAPGAALASVCQFAAGGRWATLEGLASVRMDREAVTDAERRYEERYGRTPRHNPERVVIEIRLTRAMGRA